MGEKLSIYLYHTTVTCGDGGMGGRMLFLYQAYVDDNR